MKFVLRVLVLLVICLFIGYNTDLFFEKTTERNEAQDKVEQKNMPTEAKKANETSEQLPATDENMGSFVNQDFSKVKAKFGDPIRVDKTPYGYDNYVYNQPNTSYMLVGVRNHKVQTIYALGQDLNLKPYQIGMSVEKVFTNAKLQSEIAFYYENNFYRFELSENDLNMRPVVSLGSGVYAQLNFDKIDGKLTSVRYLNKLSFIKMHPYELNYQGEIYKENVSSDLWNQVDKAADLEVLEITNVLRERYKAEPVADEQDVAKVAYGHSVDMAENKYFSHDSPTYGSLGDRLKEGNVVYTKAGENIAYNYIDAAAAVEGWLNSPGHRKNLLEKTYTYMGSGTFRKYYTQNFVTKIKRRFCEFML
ncbi:CAP domain-containing protein [Listeria aquatica]|uniref:CAP domain-containing protein n=1 Tax=Listeria aquatica TaxID=1494960 RepID=UPI000568195C|nr:CAP domain-containing protein [Listeria aquatica]